MSDTSVYQQLKEMARLTILSGKVNDIQLNSLQRFPLVMLNGVRSSTVTYDLAHREFGDNAAFKSNSSVEYQIDIDEERENDHLTKRLEYIEKSVRSLFWNDIAVTIYFNNKKVFESSKNE